MPSRDDAFALVCEYNNSASLRQHALAVESAMLYMAKKYQQNPTNWALAGLLHDLDYEQFPEEHCFKAQEILKERAYDEEVIRAVMSHGWQICTDVKPRTLMEKSLYAVDELTGLITACVLVRPNKSILDLSLKSVKKKWKQKSFAAGASREVISKGAELLGIEKDELITDVLEAMRHDAAKLGLEGEI